MLVMLWFYLLLTCVLMNYFLAEEIRNDMTN